MAKLDSRRPLRISICIICGVLGALIGSLYVDYMGWIRCSYWASYSFSGTLGILAQIIGFLITVFLTGFLVVEQSLASRLPPPIVSRVRGHGPYRMLAVLFVLLVFCILALLLSSQQLIPLVTTSVLVLFLGGSVVTCYVSLIQNMHALNIGRVFAVLKADCLGGFGEADVEAISGGLEALKSVYELSIDRKESEVSSLAIRSFFEVVQQWTPDAQGHMNYLLDDEKGKVGQIRAFILDGPREFLMNAVHSCEHVTFGVVVRSIASIITKTHEDLRNEYKEHLLAIASLKQPILPPECMSHLLYAGLSLAQAGVDSGDSGLVKYAGKLLYRIWVSGPEVGGTLRLSILRNEAMILAKLVQSSNSAIDSVVTTLFFEGYKGLGMDLVRCQDEVLFSEWAAGLGYLLETSIKVPLYAKVVELMASAMDVFMWARQRNYEWACCELGNEISSALRSIPMDRNDTYIQVYDLFKGYGPAHESDPCMHVLAQVFVWIHECAIKSENHIVAVDALKAMSKYPLSKNILDFRILNAYQGSAQEAISKRNSQLAEDVMDVIREAMKMHGDEATESYMLYLVDITFEIIEAEVVGKSTYRDFIDFCLTQSSWTSSVKHFMLQRLNDFAAAAKTGDIMSLSCTQYKEIALTAVVDGEEETVRLLSNYMGWLAYHSMTSEISTKKKIMVVNNIIDTTVLVARLARVCDLSKRTRLFLQTLYSVLGAVVVELDDRDEAAKLFSMVRKAIADVDELELFKEATLLRAHTFHDVDELRGKGATPYQKLLINLKMSSAFEEVAAGLGVSTRNIKKNRRRSVTKVSR